MSREVILVTGCAGFIGSHFCRVLRHRHPGWTLVGFDLMTPQCDLRTLPEQVPPSDMTLVHGDIRDLPALIATITAHGVTRIVNFAAESHNDRAVLDPTSFVSTNGLGVQTVLEAARLTGVRRVLQVSTIEVYGDLHGDTLFTEESPLDPRTPYAASKAMGDMIARAYARTYTDLEVVITHSANNYGPYQFPEKFIPTCALWTLMGKDVPLYGDGRQERDWVHVEDNCQGLVLALETDTIPRGEPAIFDFSARDLVANIDIARLIIAELGGGGIALVADRPNHDRRYGIDPARAEQVLGFQPRHRLADGLAATVRWYRERRDWWEPIVRREQRLWFDWSSVDVVGRSR